MRGNCFGPKGLRARRRRRAFTLTELAVLAVVCGVLAAVFYPAVAYGFEQARDAGCKAHLRRLWIATTYYANSHDGSLFVNTAPPLRISNVIYRGHRVTGWGALFPGYLKNWHDFYCPSDQGRGPAWTYGWSNWGARAGEVQCSYGYRGRQGFVAQPNVGLTVSSLERHPRKVLGCDFHEPFFDPPRIHHDGHLNLVRCDGQVEQVNEDVRFGPGEGDIQIALDTLDRYSESR